MNPVIMFLVMAVVCSIAAIVVFVLFHSKLTALLNSVESKFGMISTAMTEQGQKVAVIHHVVTTTPAPTPDASPKK